MANLLFNMEDGERKELTEMTRDDAENVVSFIVFGNRDDNPAAVRTHANQIRDRIEAQTEGTAWSEEAAQEGGHSLVTSGVAQNGNPYANVRRAPRTTIEDITQAVGDLFGSE